MPTLDEMMGFGSVVNIDDKGNVTDSDLFAPDVYIERDDDGSISAAHEQEMIDMLKTHGWEVLSGYTGQYSYNGSLMHPSEYIGGRLERDILAQPGTYVALIVDTFDDDDSDSWIVARKLETDNV